MHMEGFYWDLVQAEIGRKHWKENCTKNKEKYEKNKEIYAQKRKKKGKCRSSKYEINMFLSYLKWWMKMVV